MLLAAISLAKSKPSPPLSPLSPTLTAQVVADGEEALVEELLQALQRELAELQQAQVVVGPVQRVLFVVVGGVEGEEA
jgi:hypothetical protein